MVKQFDKPVAFLLLPKFHQHNEAITIHYFLNNIFTFTYDYDLKWPLNGQEEEMITQNLAHKKNEKISSLTSEPHSWRYINNIINTEFTAMIL